MKDGDSSGSTNTVVAATTSSASSSSSNTSASVAPPQQQSGASSSSLSVESCGLAHWQRGTVRDPHSSSDTDDCDLDIGIGRLVIDLEADLDSKSLASGTEMKSSGGIAQKSTTTSSTFAGISAASATTSSHGSSISVACNNSSDANLHLNRAAKVAPSATDTLKSSSHRSLMKNVPSNSSFIPVSAVQGDFVDRGIKVRIKCSQSTQSSSSGGQTLKHEIFPFHSPFLTSSVENTATTSAGAADFAASRVVGDRNAHRSTNLGKSNCSRSTHKKDRHSTKDRSKVTGVGRCFADDLVLCNSSSGSSSSSHSICATVANKETVDAAAVLKSDSLAGDGGPPKISASSSDPYEFNMKTEDTVGLPVKKMKLDRVSGRFLLTYPGFDKSTSTNASSYHTSPLSSSTEQSINQSISQSLKCNSMDQSINNQSMCFYGTTII